MWYCGSQKQSGTVASWCLRFPSKASGNIILWTWCTGESAGLWTACMMDFIHIKGRTRKTCQLIWQPFQAPASPIATWLPRSGVIGSGIKKSGGLRSAVGLPWICVTNARQRVLRTTRGNYTGCLTTTLGRIAPSPQLSLLQNACLQQVFVSLLQSINVEHSILARCLHSLHWSQERLWCHI